MFGLSPFFGVTIRNRQSSVTIEIQYPVRSTGAAALAAGGGPAGAPRWADISDDEAKRKSMTVNATGSVVR
jgi:hypothetical protein